jgi:hypothetical protein
VAMAVLPARPRAGTRCRPQPGSRPRHLAHLTGLAAVGAVLALAWPALGPGSHGPVDAAQVVQAADVPLDVASRPVRIWVPYVGIDLPIISSDRNLPGNPRGYPLCDVAQYWTRFDLPGEPGTTWIIGHAQEGMFLPLYEHTYGGDTNELVGKLVQLQLRDKRLLTYRIIEVRPSAAYTDVSIARRPNKDQQRLILQTSTGTGTDPKLQVAARLVKAEYTTEPPPTPHPRACWQPRQVSAVTTRRSAQTRATAVPDTPAPTPDSPDSMTLMLGSGAILLGATVVAVYLIRRP